MNLKQSLGQARRLLTSNHIEDASLEAELLLRHTVKISRAELYMEFNCELSPEHEAAYWHLIKRRLKGEPSAYITRHREFYGLDFYVDPSVLIPRPESELLVEKAINLAQNQTIVTIAEVGTGCGAIAISLALNLPTAEIYATDISASALKVTLSNCQRHGVIDRICLRQGDMLDPLPEPVDIIIANLPYVKEAELARTGSLSFEPPLALNGGTDGLEKIYKLCQQVSGKLKHQGSLLLEIGQGQRQPTVAFLRRFFPSAQIGVIPDLGGIERVVSLRLTENHPDAKIAMVLPGLKSISHE
ncbi:peptide chain release factor N(5)-glutamine methyltransferase [Chloroflexota bacterium]